MRLCIVLLSSVIPLSNMWLNHTFDCFVKEIDFVDLLYTVSSFLFFSVSFSIASIVSNILLIYCEDRSDNNPNRLSVFWKPFSISNLMMSSQLFCPGTMLCHFCNSYLLKFLLQYPQQHCLHCNCYNCPQ
jgi:hypothetical protein